MCIHFQNGLFSQNVKTVRKVSWFFFHLSEKLNCKQSQLTKVCKICIVTSKSFWWGRVKYDEINKALEFVLVVRNPQFITSYYIIFLDWRIFLILLQISRPMRNFGRYLNQANVQQTSLISPVESYWLISSQNFIMVKSEYRSKLCLTIMKVSRMFQNSIYNLLHQYKK